MCKFWVITLIFLCVTTPVQAIDLSIKDPVVNNLEISLNASLSATSNYYLQGTIRSQSSSKYFGETQNSKGDWIDYVSSPEKEYIASNFFVSDVQNASWSGQVKIRFKIDDPNYLGPGPYDLKLRRFTGGSSSSAGESNTLNINLTGVIPTPTPSPSPTSMPTPTPSATQNPSPSPSPVGAGSSRPSPIVVTSPPPIGTVAGESTQIDLSGFGVPSASPVGADNHPPVRPVINRSRAKTVLMLGAGLVILSVAGYFAYRKYDSVYNREV